MCAASCGFIRTSKRFGTSTRSRASGEAWVSTSRRRAAVISTGCRPERKVRANAPFTARSRPRSKLSRIPTEHTSSSRIATARRPPRVPGDGSAGAFSRRSAGARAPKRPFPAVLASSGPVRVRTAGARASGGIGRRARFRSVCPKGRGGSTPPSRTSPQADRQCCTAVGLFRLRIRASSARPTAAAFRRSGRVQVGCGHPLLKAGTPPDRGRRDASRRWAFVCGRPVSPGPCGGARLLPRSGVSAAFRWIPGIRS